MKLSNKITRSKGIRQLAYLAGVIDGEGTIGIYHNKKRNEYRLKVYVVNTDERLIRWLQDNFGGYVYSRVSVKNPHWKRKYEWHLLDDELLLEKILKYLVVKQENAKLGIEFRKTFQNKKSFRLSNKIKEKRKNICSEMQKLNHRI